MQSCFVQFLFFTKGVEHFEPSRGRAFTFPTVLLRSHSELSVYLLFLAMADDGTTADAVSLLRPLSTWQRNARRCSTQVPDPSVVYVLASGHIDTGKDYYRFAPSIIGLFKTMHEAKVVL